jgi:hypothetical protein
LCPAELDHALGCRVRDFDLAEDRVAVVGEDDAAHGVEQHLQHGLRVETWALRPNWRSPPGVWVSVVV